MREILTYGSVGGRSGNRAVYPIHRRQTMTCRTTLANYLKYYCSLNSWRANNFISPEANIPNYVRRASFDARVALIKEGCMQSPLCRKESGMCSSTKDHTDPLPPVDATLLDPSLPLSCRKAALEAVSDTYEKGIRQMDLAACDQAAPGCIARYERSLEEYAQAKERIKEHAARAASRASKGRCSENAAEEYEYERAFVQMAEGGLHDISERCDDESRDRMEPETHCEEDVVEDGVECEACDRDDDGDFDEECCSPRLRTVYECTEHWRTESELPCTQMEYSVVQAYESWRGSDLSEKGREEDIALRKQCVTTYEEEVAKREARLKIPTPPTLPEIRAQMPDVDTSGAKDVCLDAVTYNSEDFPVNLAVIAHNISGGQSVALVVPEGVTIGDLCNEHKIEEVYPVYRDLVTLHDGAEAEARYIEWLQSLGVK